jgi:hypothetical protein
VTEDTAVTQAQTRVTRGCDGRTALFLNREYLDATTTMLFRRLLSRYLGFQSTKKEALVNVGLIWLC